MVFAEPMDVVASNLVCIMHNRGHACSSQGGDPMDKYDVIGLVIAIVAVSVVLMH
jgi:hypothetical protein